MKTLKLLSNLRGKRTNSSALLQPSRFINAALKPWVVVTGALLAGTAAFLVIGATTPPAIKALSLSSEPLFASATVDKPVLALAISAEFPTVGAQYRDTVYSPVNEFLGYYDAESCYSYVNAPTEVGYAAVNYSDYKRFDRIGPAVARKCTGTVDGFSGNFLNFASSSSIDMLRLALSGGDRVVDTGSASASLTILQRAVLPDGDPSCFWNSSSNFPAKSIPKDSGDYLGAVPKAMRTEATGSVATGADILVANTLNRIYFGVSTSATSVVLPVSGCGSTTKYTLGGTPASATGPVTKGVVQTLPGDASAACAAEYGTCTFSDVKEVWYGAGTSWAVAPGYNSVSCSNGVFGDPIGGTPKNCYTRPYTGTWKPSGGGTMNSDGFFYARVQVCNVNASKVLQDNRDYGLCTQQPNGFYKPTGTIQKYSNQVRLAAFGYLMDQTASWDTPTPGRYGGVLRAPMKYVGSKTFDNAGIDNTPNSGNPNAEWDANTGVFAANPDVDTTQTTPISGVINYLNKFGRTGPVPGRYKKYDPISEMYGEVLRYLQGLPPTPEAVSGLADTKGAFYDGFPVATTWADPYGGGRTNTTDYSCVKGNIAVVGDINTHDGDRLLKRTADLSNNLPDFSYGIGGWNYIVSAFESGTAATYTDGQGASRSTSNPNTKNTQSPSVSQGSPASIMGQAYWAHTHDIRGKNWTANPALQRPGLRVKSFFFDVNEGGSGSDTSNRQNRNQFFTASKYGGFNTEADKITLSKPFNTSGNPFTSQSGTTDNNVWQDEANPGEAQSYYLSSSARSTLAAFDKIFNTAAVAANSIAKSAVSNKNLTTAGSSIYQGAFNTSDWSGEISSVPLSLTGTSTISLGSPTWTAAAALAARSAASRNIVIGREGSAANPTATPFLWASIDSTMKTNLNKVAPTNAADALGSDRLDYLRGDRTKEGAPFRTRSTPLGDVVNAGIVYSGALTTNIIPYTDEYKTFFTSNSGRTPALFVGANDGMLHSFNALTGAELFGYIPSWMGPKLAALTVNTYTANHQAYVDATPAVAEAQVGSAGSASDWKTVLVGGTGAGGPGVYALDVTDPTAFSASKVMWEFTKADDADMGYVVGQPQILKLRTSASTVKPATYRWFALVASGVNNYLPFPDTSGTYSTTGNPALFLLALDKPAGTAWSATGSSPNYYKLSVPVDPLLNATNATGLINFATTLGPLRELSQVYMGDLHGKVWRLDFSERGAADWVFEKLSFYKVTATDPYPLYAAKTAAGLVQPISMAPAVVAAGTLKGLKRNYVAFATGKYLENADKTSTAQNSFYAILEDGTASATAGGASVPGRGRLQAGTIDATTLAVTVPPFKWGRATKDSDAQRSGWYVDYVASGEKSISSPLVVGDVVNFVTVIPLAAGTSGSCTANGGGGGVYAINVDTGVGISSRIPDIPGPQLYFDTPSTTYTISTSTGRRVKTINPLVVLPTSGALKVAPPNPITIVSGRLSWRQINNYQDLKNDTYP